VTLATEKIALPSVLFFFSYTAAGVQTNYHARYRFRNLQSLLYAPPCSIESPQGPAQNCSIFPKDGSAYKKHAKNKNLHPDCTAECTASSGKILTRDLTDEDWARWARTVAEIYPGYSEQIPLRFLQDGGESDRFDPR
jgi:hypothetical protein